MSGGKVMSPTDRIDEQRSSTLAKALGDSGSFDRSPLQANYPVCHIKSPTVHCVKLNIPNGDPYKTELEEHKTESCPKTMEVAPFKVSEKADANMNADQSIPAPDSTTSHSFSCGEDVFVQNKDGRYYLGTVMRTETSAGRWLVKFGDNTEKWAGVTELRPFSSPSGDDAPPMCVICKQSSVNRTEEVIACDKCSRGYHPSCHSPPVNSYVKGSWYCRICTDHHYKPSSEHKMLRKEFVKSKNSQKKLPYDLESLHWDPYHRKNSESTYCYCGCPGDWFAQMLQCARCKQWFHQQCIMCLKYPLYTGDRFYVFVCSLCNFGSEFLRRLEMKWVDLVHLVLFNLTKYHSRKYFDLDQVIIPYTTDNWHALQLPQKMHSTSVMKRRELILSALSNNGNRFKCGREIKKRTTIWGLRSRTPPPPPTSPTAPLPRGLLSDNALSGRWGRLAFVPYPPDTVKHSNSNEQQMIVPADGHWQYIMMGKQFQISSCSDVESPRSSPSPMTLPEVPSGYQISNDYNKNPNFDQKSKEEVVDSDYNFSDDTPLSDRRTQPYKQRALKFYEMDYQGGGFVKKSVPFPKIIASKRSKLNDNSKQKNKKRKEQSNIDNNEILNRNRRKLRKSLINQEKIKSFKSLLSKGTVTNHVAETTNFETMEIDRLSKDSIKVIDVVMPPTPPTSMSTPSTPPATIIPSSSSNSSDVPPDFQLQQSSYKKDSSYDSDHDLLDFKDDTKHGNDNRKSKEKSPKKKEKSEAADNSNQINGVVPKSHKLTTINLEISKLSTKNIIEHSKIMSLHHMKMDEPYCMFPHKMEHDSSGEDTSSRGTLDSIIPHPVNFRGANNPFHNVSSTSGNGKGSFANLGLTKGGGRSMASKLFSRHSFTKGVTNVTITKCQRISLPVSLNPVIQPGVKLTKRQLCEKDLIIGPNGEVKRRRHRRNKASTLLQIQTAASKDALNERQKSLRSSLGQEELIKNSANIENNSADLAPNGRCLRQRQEKNYCDGRRGSTSSNNATNSLAVNAASITNAPSNSCTNNARSLNLSKNYSNEQWNATEDIQDLKSSVHSYFGADNRISAGEKFALLGKRLTENGKLQYLIEWEGHGS